MIKLDIQLFGGRGASSSPTQRQGFGWANKDGIPVYNGKIDYTGDFTGANLSRMSDKQLREAIDKQSDLYIEAINEKLGDQRTRNGRMDKIFNEAKKSRHEGSMKALNEEMEKRNLARYNVYSKDNKKVILVSSPTKKIAERQLGEMARVDRSLQREYGWNKLPEYVIKREKKRMK